MREIGTEDVEKMKERSENRGKRMRARARETECLTGPYLINTLPPGLRFSGGG